jgi:TPR repeat protein
MFHIIIHSGQGQYYQMSISTSSFTNRDNISGWLQELQRTTKPEDKSAKTVRCALELLQELDPKEHPEVADFAYNLLNKAALKDNVLATTLKGIATIDGFGCKEDISNGLLLLKMAAERKCAEAKNYFGLLFMAKSNLMMAMRMFRDAAYGGHPRAERNLEKLQKQLRKVITQMRLVLDKKQSRMRRRNRRRFDDESYEADFLQQEHIKKKQQLLLLVG